MARCHCTYWLPMFVVSCALVLLVPAAARSFPQYSQNRDDTNCASCHGGFRSNSYTSPSDGELWGNIHNLHRTTMLSGDCQTCHQATDDFPVLLDESGGGAGLDPIGCMGCHGRSEDDVPGNPDFPKGLGAGLRQHHTMAGVPDCLGCHDDASPENYTPVGEEVLPAYYANPGTGHGSMPTGSCNDDGSEDFAGSPLGLDNDGDLSYDTQDPGCNPTPVPGSASMAGLQQNHPNPFNPSTDILYFLDQPGHVLLQVFSVDGDLVRTLVDAWHSRAAAYEVTWNGQSGDGRFMPSGIYFYRLVAPGGVEMKKMVLIR